MTDNKDFKGIATIRKEYVEVFKIVNELKNELDNKIKLLDSKILELDKEIKDSKDNNKKMKELIDHIINS